MVLERLARSADVRAVSGGALLVAGVVTLMAIITSEALYQDPRAGAYTTHQNEISDLGGAPDPGGLVLQPSATIFNLAMVGSGGLLIGAAYGLRRTAGMRPVVVALLLQGVGDVGVGVFPEDHLVLHRAAALFALLFGGVAAMCSARVSAGPLKYISALMGTAALASLAVLIFAKSSTIYVELGAGGIERWAVYPVTLWQAAFGGYLLGSRPD